MAVVGGLEGTKIARWNEIVHMTGATVCNLRKVTDFPIKDGIGTYINGQAIVCGGGRGQIYYDECSKYDPSKNVWNKVANTMNEARKYPGGIQLDANRWWITGGMKGTGKAGALKNSEIYHADTGQFTPSVNLPLPFKFHNHFWYDDETILTFYPLESARRYYLFNTKTEKFTPKYPRNPAMANSTAQDKIWGGLTITSTGQRNYILAHVTNGEMFSITLPQHEWTKLAMPAEYKIVEPAIVPHENSFYVVGGKVAGKDSAKIYWFDPETQTLQLQNQEFTKPRKYPIAFVVPPDFNRCPPAS